MGQNASVVAIWIETPSGVTSSNLKPVGKSHSQTKPRKSSHGQL